MPLTTARSRRCRRRCWPGRATAIHLVAHDRDRVVGVDADRADADGDRAGGGEPRARGLVEAVMVADEDHDVVGCERSVTEIARILFEDVGGDSLRVAAAEIGAEIGQHRVDAAARHGQPGPDLDEDARLGIGRAAREGLLHEDREHALVGADEADVASVDAEHARRERSAEQHEVHDRVATKPVRDEERRAQAAQQDVEAAAGARDVDEREVRRGRRLLTRR